jgi:long-chain acyl-CoA synthetase
VSTSVVGERFRALCRDKPRAVAVRSLSETRTATFADLLDDVTELSRALADLGVGRGANVVSVVGNHAIFLSLVVACLESGQALLPLGEATDTEVAGLVAQSGAAAIVTDRIAPVAQVDVRVLRSGIRVARIAGSEPPQYYGESVVLKLTSGSTDLPKAAVASELHLLNDGRHVVEAMGIDADDINMACIPLSHSYALGNLVMPLLCHGTALALRQSFSPAQFLQDAISSGATVFPGVPFMFERLKSLDLSDGLPRGLRLLITAGAHMDPDTARWFRERLNRKVHSFYGSSETGGITYDDSEELAEPLHVGRAMPETAVTILGSAGGGGRIFVEGNAVTSGYAPSPAAEPIPGFQNGGFLTGDLGYLDPDGRLVLTGRASSIVNVAGRKVDPAEVERTLLDLPGISDARVLGMPCEQRGQQVVAFIVRADAALTPIAIRRLCATSLSTHKIPRRFVFVDRFPVDARGKLDRPALQALLANGEDA